MSPSPKVTLRHPVTLRHLGAPRPGEARWDAGSEGDGLPRHPARHPKCRRWGRSIGPSPRHRGRQVEPAASLCSLCPEHDRGERERTEPRLHSQGATAGALDSGAGGHGTPAARPGDEEGGRSTRASLPCRPLFADQAMKATQAMKRRRSPIGRRALIAGWRRPWPPRPWPDFPVPTSARSAT